MDGKSLEILSDKITKLKEIIPEAFTEEKIDWEKLKAALGEDINFENERYNLNWAGKSDAFRVLQQRTSGTLRPVKDESVNFDKTENVFIEGENLEVLKILQKSYFGKIKMIYIDPPYNTGSDSFIYPDKFSETKDEYLKRIGDKDEEGFLLKEGFFRKNSKESGHYHSNWLSMMYPRLYTARNLLREDGVIFVSIDDNEVHNLRMIMNEIFGEENFLSELIWDLGTGTAAGHFTRSHEYIICFAKDKSVLNNFTYSGKKDFISERAIKKISKGNPASQITFPKGISFEGTDAIFENQIGTSEIVKIIDGPMIFKNSKLDKTVTLEAGWAMRNQILSWLDGKETYDSKGQKVIRFFFDYKGRLQYEKERAFINPQTVLRKIASTRKGSQEIEDLFNNKVMDFPKPVSLIKNIIGIVSNNNDTILDFFAGSGTTAQAVMELNKEDGGNRKFILVQLPEKTDESSEAYKAKYFTIADICKERIRRVIERINRKGAETQGEIFAPSRLSGEVPGFKVFKLVPSNFKMWRSDIIETEEDLNKMIDLFDTQIKPDAKIENMLYELMLKSGFTLTDKVEKVNGYYSVNEGQAVFVLDKIDQSIIDEIVKLKPQSCIILDDLFAGNDQLKTNTALQMKDAGVELVTV
ncbi:MAG: site-specific DNA-methyltransferase [Ignavibacteriaceae bacterium]